MPPCGDAVGEPAAAERSRCARQQRDHAERHRRARLVHALVAHEHDRRPRRERAERSRERGVARGRYEPVARAQDARDRPQRGLFLNSVVGLFFIVGLFFKYVARLFLNRAALN